jgi:hypothetical protein
MIFWRHPYRLGLGDIEGSLVSWPTSVFFVAAGPVLAGVVEQALADLLPLGVLAIQPNSIHSLDFDDPVAPTARDPQHMLLDIAQSAQLDRLLRRHTCQSGPANTPVAFRRQVRALGSGRLPPLGAMGVRAVIGRHAPTRRKLSARTTWNRSQTKGLS